MLLRNFFVRRLLPAEEVPVNKQTIPLAKESEKMTSVATKKIAILDNLTITPFIYEYAKNLALALATLPY